MVNQDKPLFLLFLDQKKKKICFIHRSRSVYARKYLNEIRTFPKENELFFPQDTPPFRKER